MTLVLNLLDVLIQGVQKVVDFCNGNGNPKPRYSIQTDMVTLKILSRAENKKLSAMNGNGSNKRLLIKRMAEIEAIAEDSQISIEKIAMILNSSRRTVARDISWLIDNGYIVRKDHTKGSKLLVFRNICEDNQE